MFSPRPSGRVPDRDFVWRTHTQTRGAQLVELAHSKISRTNAEAPREHVERDARAQVLELPKPLGLNRSVERGRVGGEERDILNIKPREKNRELSVGRSVRELRC